MHDPSRKEDSTSEKREEIIAEAIRQFNQNGYADTRLEDIGASLGTVKTSVSYYFKSKEGLIEEVCDRALLFSERALERAHDRPIALNGLMDWLRVHAKAHADALNGLARPLALIGESHPSSVGPNMVSGSLKSRHEKLVEQCGELIGRGLQDGSIQVSSVPTTLLFILNILHWLPRWLSEVRPADTELAIESMTDFLTKGLARDPNRPIARSINRHSIDHAETVFNRAARNRAKREAFLRAGTRALNETGYRNLSLNDVAKELGVTRGAFYYHVADKEALLTGCFERSVELIELAQTLATNDDFDGLGMIERATRWLCERQLSNLDPLIDLRLMSALDNAKRELLSSQLARLRTGFGHMLATGLGDGSIRAVDIVTAAHLVFGSILACRKPAQALSKSNTGGSIDPTETVSSTAYVDLLRRGLSGAGR